MSAIQFYPESLEFGPVQATPSNMNFTRSISILSSRLCLRLQSGPYPLRVSVKICYAFPFSDAWHMSCPSHHWR